VTRGSLPTRAQILARRRRLRRKYRELYDRVAGILYEHDPMHIGYALDEYEAEVERILPRIATARSIAELTRAVHEVFCEMFSPELAGTRAHYEGIARDIWRTAKRAARVSA
jgi:hypothetical protein